MTRLVLDAEAFNVLAGPSSARRTEIRRVLLAVEDAGGEVIVPTVPVGLGLLWNDPLTWIAYGSV